MNNPLSKSTVTATITNAIDPRNEEKFLDWQLRIAPLQSRFPGFIGYRLKKPEAGISKEWVAIVTFDTKEHLEAWLTSPERQNMIDELHAFTGDSRIEKTYSGFNFWFTDIIAKRSIWKENMLVLLTLYPVVFLLSYLQNPAVKHGVPFWLALFFSNLISTVVLGYCTVPWLMQKFAWWLNPKQGFEQMYTFLGAALVVMLYGITLCICWLLAR